MIKYRVVSSERGLLEEKYNASLAHVGSLERVCMHPDVTVTRPPGGGPYTAECDYCPQVQVQGSPQDLSLVPYYYLPV